VENLLEVRDLHVSFDTYGGAVKAVRGVSFDVKKGECVAIVGESGCGKSVTAQSLMKLIPMPPGKIVQGSIKFDGREIVPLSDQEMQRVRGWDIGMIFQDPMTSLNPTMTIGRQIAEGLVKHQGISWAEARTKALQMLQHVGIPRPEERLDSYPYQFSGGMRQRVMIAIALACNPKLLIADEPTTALDVTIQAQILEVMKRLKKEFDTSIILITHDLGVVAGMADRVVVMYAGQVVEQGTVDDIFYRPQHPYTWGLLRSVPRLDDTEKRQLASIPGTPPDLFAPPAGCSFADRCDHAMAVCRQFQPELTRLSSEHEVHCWLKHPLAPPVAGPDTRRATAHGSASD
jgi:oligopeptide transport system ATP-binding protein